jgi:hypothetical protein
VHSLTPIAAAVAQMRPALCLIVDNPMEIAKAEARPVAPGTTIAELDPKGKFPAICRLDGEWLLRAGWQHQLQSGQIVEFYVYPQGGGGDGGSDVGRAILTFAAIYAAVQFGQWEALGTVGISPAVGQAVAMIALTALINVLVPVNAGSKAGDNTQASASYNTALSGNQARLEQPIPVLYGRNKTFPDFAGEPYTEYNGVDDQYYYAVMCLGQGSYNIESIMIDDTSIYNFSDMQVEVLAPGVQPTLAKANVVNAAEVTGQPMTVGRYVGPFTGCRAKSKTSRIGIDITFSRGLTTYDAAGVPGNMTVAWAVELRHVDDFGGALTEWVQIANPSLTLAQTKPVRKTYFYDLPAVSVPAPPGFIGPTYALGPSCRPQIRLVRTTPFDSNSRVMNTIEWAGFRCYLDNPAPLCATATHMAVAMRASEQLSGLTQRKIAVISRRKLRTWTGSAWTALTETRNFAWALADKWTNTTYGDGYPDSRCDLASLLSRATVADTRQDRFDGVFDQAYDSFTADQMIAQSNRCAVFRRNGVMTLTRDELKTLPVTAFTSRSIQPGTVNIDYLFANESTPDGVIVEYWHNLIWDWQEILCPVPGVTTPVRPQRLKLFGVTGSKHAQREGTYHAANSLYRRKFASFTTELEGMLPAFGSAVVFAPSLPGWGRGGDVVAFDSMTMTITVTEPLAWTSAATHYLTFVNRDGSLSAPVQVTPGLGDYQAVLVSAPTESLSVDSPDQERTRYLFGASVPYSKVLRVLGLRNTADDKGLRTYAVNGVIEDDRVHGVDTYLLPAGSEIQDSVEPSNPDTGSSSGTAYRAYLVPLIWGAAQTAELQFRNDGTVYMNDPAYGAVQLDLDTWLLGRTARSTAVTGLFEIRATLLSGVAPTGSALGSWLLLSTTRSWTGDASTPGSAYAAQILVEIRLAATLVVQSSAVYGWNMLNALPP